MKTRRNLALRLVLAAFCWLGARPGAWAAESTRLGLVWPTPNTAFIEGRPRADYLQATASGEPESGGYGSVRDGGDRFHEGIDLKALARDQAGEPVDKIFAVMPGVVRHVSDRAGDSNYGRYVVLEHPSVEPAIYTLYAHLRSIAPGLVPGAQVGRGQALGVMGRSDGGTGIPRERAHLHFEMGLRVTDKFEAWYGRQKFGRANEHGAWNGYNLLGFDPLEFYGRFRAREINTLADFFAGLRPAVRVRVATQQTPDFTLRYPSLVPAPGTAAHAGWEIACSATGLPFRWVPLPAAEMSGYAPNEVRVIATDPALLATQPGKSLIVQQGNRAVPGKDLQTLLQQLFGW